MSPQNNVPIDSRKLEISRIVRKAERRALGDYLEKLRILSGLSQTQRDGYLKLLSHTLQDIEEQISQISRVIKQKIIRLNNGWPVSDIRKAKADELRADRKTQRNISKQVNTDIPKIGHMRKISPGGER
ncbi:MAG: hypothetical protein IJV07_04990 [Alphaproteobacteria bacterium]|nr:hypothetical protein [Alphaproteobacteria bacterium]